MTTFSNVLDKIVLVITENPDWWEICRRNVESQGAYRVQWSKSASDTVSLLETQEVNVIFFDLDIKDCHAPDWVKKATDVCSPYIIGIISNSTGNDLIIDCVKSGTYDLIYATDLTFDTAAAFERAKKRGSHVAMLQMETEKMVKDNTKTVIDSFKLFVDIRKTSLGEDRSVKRDEVLNYFPHMDQTQFTPEQIADAFYNNDLLSLLPKTKPKLLCVEDEPDLQDIFQKSFDYFEVTSVLNAEDAIALAQKESFDTILIDIGLPKMQGDILVGELKTINPQNDIMVLSAYNTCSLIVRCFKRGASDFFVKPFDMADLQLKMKASYEEKMLLFSLNTLIKHMERIYKFEDYPDHEIE